MKKFFIDPKTGKLRKLRAFIVVFIGLAIIGVALGEEDTTQQSNSEQSTVQAEEQKQEQKEQKQEEKVYKIGDKVAAGKLVYQIESVEEKKSLKNVLGEKKPGSGTFLILTLTIENKDNENRTVSQAMTKLIDKEGNEYEPDTNAFMYLEQNSNNPFLDGINPKGKKTFKIVYDVAGKAEDYTFVGTGGFDLLENGEARIKLTK
ncbi:DUF4352 domain-containing protein [Planifilum fimeticola]